MSRYTNLMPSEVYVEIMVTLSRVLCENGSYMKGEMLYHRTLTEVEKSYDKVRAGAQMDGCATTIHERVMLLW